MRLSFVVSILALACTATFAPAVVAAQTPLNLAALRGLGPFSALESTPAGRAALEANYSITGAIQAGIANQPGLQPFDLAQQQALRDAFITFGNASQLADGLGTKLGGVYQSMTAYASADDGATTPPGPNVSANVANLIAYTAALTAADAGSAKFYFANATAVSKSGTTPVSSDAATIMTALGGSTDVYGKAYGLPAGSAGADPYGDSRPFQTEKTVVKFSGKDYFGVASGNDSYLSGPAQNLVKSPAFPSGHTTYGYTESLLLALMVPERYPQMIVRAAEYGNDRIIMGAHYTMDVLGGRTLAYYDVAHLLARDPVYVGKAEGGATIVDYPAALQAAKDDFRKALAAGCGGFVVDCAGVDTGRFSDPARTAAFYESTQTYGLPAVYAATDKATEDVAALAPEAGYLLTVAFPTLTLAQADRILTDTEGPGGGFLDNGSAFGVYSRLDLYKAGLQATRGG